MKGFFTLILILILILNLNNCGSNVIHDKLNRVDIIMESNPDSANLILKSIDIKELTDEKELAYFYLLSTQAGIETDSVIKDPSYITYALNYFDKYGSGFDRLRAWFYKGYVSYQNEDYRNAIFEALNAIDLADEQNNIYWQAKANELAGYIYNRASLYDEAVKCDSIAAKKYKQSNKILNERYALCDVAINYICLNKFDESNRLLDSIRSASPKDPYLEIYCRNSLIAALFLQKDFSKIEVVADSIHDSEYSTFDPFTKLIIAEAKLTLGKLDESKVILNNCDTTAQSWSVKKKYHRIKSYQYLKEGDKDKYYLHMDSANFFYDKYLSNPVYSKVILNEKVRYDNSKTEMLLKQKDNKILISTIVVILMTVIIASLWLIKSWMQKKKLSDLENRVELLTSLTEQLSVSEYENESLKLYISNLMKDKWHLLNSIYGEYFERGISSESKNYVMRQIQLYVDNNKTIDKINELTAVVDAYSNGIISKIKYQCPKLSDDDIIVFTFICAGMSPKSISLLMGLKIKGFYTKRDRLIQKIEKINPEDKDLFISMIK